MRGSEPDVSGDGRSQEGSCARRPTPHSARCSELSPTLSRGMTERSVCKIEQERRSVLAAAAPPVALHALLSHLFASRLAHPFVDRLLRGRFSMLLPWRIDRSAAEAPDGGRGRFRDFLRLVFQCGFTNWHQVRPWSGAIPLVRLSVKNDESSTGGWSKQRNVTQAIG